MLLSLFLTPFDPIRATTRPATFVFVVFVSCRLVRIASSGIVESPQSDVIVPLNTSGMFVCKAESSDMGLMWQIQFPGQNNPAPQNYLASQFAEREVSVNTTNNTSTLTISGLPENNNTVVYCVVFDDQSHEVSFIVFGPPKPPESITFDVAGDGLISLSWPFSPTYFDKALTYELHTSKDDQLIDVIPVNETAYQYRFQEKECETYRFAVYSVNEAGTSANFTEISVAVPTVPDQVKGLQIAVLGLTNYTYHINIQFIVEGCLDSYPLSDYIINITSVVDGSWYLSAYNTSSLANGTANGGTISVGLEEKLLGDSAFSISVSAANEVGTGRPSDEMNFYTNDVQSVKVSLGQAFANISCLLLSGSDALGCFVTISIGNRVVVKQNISHQNYVASNSFPVKGMETYFSPADVHVEAYDWEKDGNITLLSMQAEVVLEDLPLHSSPTAAGPRNSNSLYPLRSDSPVVTALPDEPAGELSASLYVIVIVTVTVLVLMVVVMVTVLIVMRRIRPCRKSYAVQDHNSTSSITKRDDDQDAVQPYGVVSVASIHAEPLYQEVATNGDPTITEVTQIPHYQTPPTCPHYHVLENQKKPVCTDEVRQNPSAGIYDEVCRERSDQPDGNTSPCSSSSTTPPPPIPQHYSTRDIPPQLRPLAVAKDATNTTRWEVGTFPRNQTFNVLGEGIGSECGRSLTPSFEPTRYHFVHNGSLHSQQDSLSIPSRACVVDNRPAGWPRRNRSNSDSLGLIRTISRNGVPSGQEHQTLQRTLV